MPDFPADRMRFPKTVAILQSNYIPWKGYFDVIACADEFVIFDEVQFTRRDWRNRNKIIAQGRPHWLTIPVKNKGRFEAPINDIEVADRVWPDKHWQAIRHAYSKAPHFADVGPALKRAFEQAEQLALLTEVNELFLKTITELIAIPFNVLRSDAVPRTSVTPTERLVEICLARDAKLYISGPAAKAYIEREKFDTAGLALRYVDYSGYPVYEQASETFDHAVSFVDVLMRCGVGARSHLKALRAKELLLEPV